MTSVLRRAIPEIEEISASLLIVIVPQGREGFREVELVEVVIAIEGQRGAKVIGGEFEVALIAVNEAAVIHLGGERVLPGVEGANRRPTATNPRTVMIDNPISTTGGLWAN